MRTVSRIWLDSIGRFLFALERSLLVWDKPIPVVILSLIIFTGIASTAGLPWRLSTAPYYNLLADALLHGQLHLRIIPESTVDLSLFQGRYYLYWGPLPALFAIPLVALFGPGVSDVLQNLFFSALTVGLQVLVLQAASARGVIRLTPSQRALLVLFFALGTAYLPITSNGHVWQISQVQSILFVFLAFLAAFRLEGGRAFFFTGCAMAGVLLTRMSAVFVGVYLAWYLINRRWQDGPRRLIRCVILGLLPVFAAVSLTGLYNFSRFGNPLESGVNYHLLMPYFANDFLNYGLFHPRFISENFYYTYVFYPYSFSQLGVTVRCGSLFLLSPLFFWALVAVWEHRRHTATWMLLLSILLGNIPILLLMGPGSSLFGPRYTLDFVMPLLLLTAVGMERLPLRYASILTIVSILQYLLGSLIYVHGVP